MYKLVINYSASHSETLKFSRKQSAEDWAEEAKARGFESVLSFVK